MTATLGSTGFEAMAAALLVLYASALLMLFAGIGAIVHVFWLARASWWLYGMALVITGAIVFVLGGTNLSTHANSFDPGVPTDLRVAGGVMTAGLALVVVAPALRFVVARRRGKAF